MVFILLKCHLTPPELQPAERLWPLTNEPIANRTFKDLDEVEEILFNRLRSLRSTNDSVLTLQDLKSLSIRRWEKEQIK
jgi:hypothetical protein